MTAPRRSTGSLHSIALAVAIEKILVVDASVAVAACHTPVGFASLRGHKLLAPQLMLTEADKGIRGRGQVRERRGY
jgi:hypothetical protein